MKKSRFTDSQIMAALKRVEAGLAVPEICRELGISSATFYKWRARLIKNGVRLLHRNRLGQIAWLIHIRATRARSLVCKQL